MIGRTHDCGKLREEHDGETVCLQGWVQRRRDLGGVIFIDLRDRSGIVQVVVDSDDSAETFRVADQLRNEFVVTVKGKVVKRDENTVNPALSTGRIEVVANDVIILNEAKNPPFVIEDRTEVGEDVRLKYRYLDLRRPVMQETFKLRHRITKRIRDFLDAHDFLEIETPMLTKSTPEGARDYLVPSRVHPGEFYALPQSPQLFKQLLMVSGFERYFQIVRCFRDEDLRADRQPEFTQVDIETSFLHKEDLLAMMEKMIAFVVKETKGIDVPLPFPRMSYEQAMSRFGSDKPDTRFGMELIDVSEAVKNASFNVFSSAVASGGCVKALNVKQQADAYTRKDIDGLTDFVKVYGAKGLAWIKVGENGFTGPIAKFFSEQEAEIILNEVNGEVGDLLLFVADESKVVHDSLGALRLKLGKDLQLIDNNKLNFLWVTEFPLVTFDEEEGRYVSEHHPFTSPLAEDVEWLRTDPARVRADAYDLVLNGYELGGGSVRIYKRSIQEQVFHVLGFSDEEAVAQFGFLLDAFEYGTPPHAGIAFGLDRLVMILAGRDNLRDTIAFPKTASASCLMTDAPSPVSEVQLEELHLKKKHTR